MLFIAAEFAMHIGIIIFTWCVVRTLLTDLIDSIDMETMADIMATVKSYLLSPLP